MGALFCLLTGRSPAGTGLWPLASQKSASLLRKGPDDQTTPTLNQLNLFQQRKPPAKCFVLPCGVLNPTEPFFENAVRCLHAFASLNCGYIHVYLETGCLAIL